MPNRIKEDHKKFHDVVKGNSRRELRKNIRNGSIVRQRPKGGRIVITIPRIDTPHFVFGENDEGVGRGPGKDGDIIGRDPPRGDGKGNKAGDQPGDGVRISLDMEDVFDELMEDFKLPEMKPKPTQTFEEIKTKYTNISRVGLNSLRHTRRTMKEALKRLAGQGDADKLHSVPGASVPIRIISPIKKDFRYRQYREIKIPASNAVIFFARDCSGSMDEYRCEIVSDMSWWIDCWIKRFYKKVDRCYFVHDTEAREVDEETFYTIRDGGGTKCSSAFAAIAEQLVHRYPPSKFNIYVFYFTDGDNWGEDNKNMIQVVREKLGPDAVNLIGVTQVCSWGEGGSVKQQFDKEVQSGGLGNVTTVSIGNNQGEMSEEDRNSQILGGIRKILTSKENA